jgi:hypothetical protein
MGSLRKVSGFYSLRIVDLLISTYIIVRFHDCIDSVVAGAKSLDEDSTARDLGYYD